MDAERIRAYLLTLPFVVETVQWGNNLVFWVGDKAIGGKMFALVDLDGGKQVISYAAGAEHYAELLEREGFIPAPYFARISWVAANRWDALRQSEWQRELSAAHELTLARLPVKVRAALDLPDREMKKLIMAKTATKAAMKKAAAR